MSEIKKKYKEILKELENSKDLEYVKEQLKKISNAFMSEIEKIEESTNTKFQEFSKKQEMLEGKVSHLEKILNGIEKDIYDVDENYDLEIVCPYCDYEFVIDEDVQGSEIECPECDNIIEIDWEGECFEGGCNCSECSSPCGIEEEFENNLENENNEDDM